MNSDQSSILALFQKMPNVGPAFARDLLLLEFSHPDQLKGKSPEALYYELERITAKKQDPCVLDTFMAVVHFVETGEKRTWWSFTAERKHLLKKKTLE